MFEQINVSWVGTHIVCIPFVSAGEGGGCGGGVEPPTNLI